jgi:prepilin-type N-terminal cleavage/methylation domain-containing protein
MRRQGFTIIELLVTIATIGVLIALLFPAVQSAREAGRRVQCANNLKQIALAMLNYNEAVGTLPPGRKGWGWGTWQMFVLPYIEQQPLYDAYNQLGDSVNDVTADSLLLYMGPANESVTTQRLAVFTCPSDTPNAPLDDVTSHNYGCNYGNTDIYAAANLNGVLFRGAPFGDIGADPDKPDSGTQTVRLARIIDGTSRTMLAAELIQGQGADFRGFTWYGPNSGFTAYLGPNSTLADVLMEESQCVYPFSTNPPCTWNTLQDNAPVYGASRSRHAGGVSVVLADGSVHFIKNQVNLSVWRALSTTQGKETVSDDAY